jgi:WD40 repeat protein
MAAESASKSDRPSDNSSDRRITIGENVTDSLVVSGDANQVTYNKIIQISASVVQTRELSQSSPYKGLKGFGLKDKERFFGRDQLIARLLNAVRQHNFVLVSGASGSGKSSVVRAGLIPQLYQRFGSCFQHFIFTPDRDPFDSLYRSLCNPELDQHCSVTDAQIALQAGPDTLMQVVQTLKPKASQWLFFIDQFEELFTIYQDIKKRKTFIEGLIQVANSGESSVTLVLAMRSDFLDQISPYPELGKLAEQTIHFVTDMYLDELRLAIEQPAAQHGVVFEDGLVDKIAEHVEGQAGYLPLLQYTLNLLWETEVETGSIHDRTLNISTYRNLGGVRGALQKHIDQIYGALSKEEKLAAQRIFLKLVEIGGNEESGTEWKSVRRRATRSEFDSEVEQRVLMQLIDENLLVSDRHPQAQEATVEIAHEALLSSWETLNSWITEHRRAIALRNRLNDDVTQWQVEKKEDELWSGAKLLRMQELRKDPTFNQVLGGFSTAANQFIDASLSRRNRQRHRTIIGLAGFSTIALVLAGVASWQWQRSERLRLTTEADQLGILALRGFESGRGEIESLLSAIDAGQKLKALVDSNASPESYPTTSPVLALQTILDNVQERNQFNGHRGQIYGVSFSPDGQRFVTISEDSAVRLWELNGKNTLLEGHKGEVWDIKFASNGQLFATIGEDATVRLWDISGHLVREWQVDKGGCHSLIFTPDGQRLITACSKFGIWDLSGNKIDEWENQNQNAVLSMSISQNGNYLLSSGFGDIVQLRDLSSKKLKLNLKFQQPYIPSVSFTPDNQQFVTATRNGDIQFWDLSGKNIKTFNNQSVISDMKFSPNGQRLAVAGVDGKVRFWSMEGKLLTQFDDPASVDALCFSPDGQHLVMVGERGNIKLLELSKQLMNILNIAGERDGVNLDASLDGKYLATASGGYAQIWDLSRGLLSNWVADGNGWFVSSLSLVRIIGS